MRIAVVSDIHGNLPALLAVQADIERRGVDEVVCLGNVVSGPLMPLETAHHLIALPWLHIAGNHEPRVLGEAGTVRSLSDSYAAHMIDDPVRHWMSELPRGTDPRLLTGELWAERLGPGVAVCHASPRSDSEYLLETPDGSLLRLADAAEIEERLADRIPEHIGVLLCGHSHVPRVLRLPRGLLVVNPGAVGLPAYDVSRPFPLSNYHRVETGTPDARYAIAEQRDGVWSAHVMDVPYDHEAAAQQALRNGRPEWSHALRTGYWPHLL